MDSVLTAELAAADGADDNDADGNAERDDSMVGQRGRRLRRSSKRGLEGLGRRRLALVAVHDDSRFCSDSTMALRKKRAREASGRAV